MSGGTLGRQKQPENIIDRIKDIITRLNILDRVMLTKDAATGQYVQKIGDTMSGALILDPAAGITDGILQIDAPASSVSTYTFKITRGGQNVLTLRDDGSFRSYDILAFEPDRGISSGSSGAQIIFPVGGGNPGNIVIDSSTSNGTRKATIFIPAIGRGLYWGYDGVDGTARVVFDNGTGDVLYGVTGQFFIRDSAGNIAGGQITATAPGGTFNLYNDGGTNTCQLIVNANGEITVQRTAGARTYKVILSIIWL